MAQDQFTDTAFQKMLAKARSGDDAAVGELLNKYRDYLLLIANQQMDRQLQGKIGGSDIVQESMFAAQQGFHQFEGDSPAQFMAWLRKILINDVYETGRKFRRTAKRQVDKEVELSSGASRDMPLVDPGDTPKTDAMMKEERRRLREAMMLLSDDHREVLKLRNWDQLPFAEIGVRLDRSEEAARKLWTRAVLQLHKLMGNN